MSQSVRRRIRAFDERMAILANRGAKVAAHENTDSESDPGEEDFFKGSRRTSNSQESRYMIQRFSEMIRIDSR